MIKPGRGWKGHIPGQYIRVGVDVDGVRQWRAYSLTSTTDRPDGCISITVKAIPDGTVSNYLVRRATVGTVIQLDQAAGEFTLDTPAPAKVLFVTAGSGITPVMGMLRNLRRDAASDVVVVHSAPTAADVIFGAELRMLAAEGLIKLVEIHTDTDGMLAADGLDTWSTTWPSATPGPVDPSACSTLSKQAGRQPVWPTFCTPNDSARWSSPR